MGLSKTFYNLLCTGVGGGVGGTIISYRGVDLGARLKARDSDYAHGSGMRGRVSAQSYKPPPPHLVGTGQWGGWCVIPTNRFIIV